jgi:hypothetical protein
MLSCCKNLREGSLSFTDDPSFLSHDEIRDIIDYTCSHLSQLSCCQLLDFIRICCTFCVQIKYNNNNTCRCIKYMGMKVYSVKNSAKVGALSLTSCVFMFGWTVRVSSPPVSVCDQLTPATMGIAQHIVDSFSRHADCTALNCFY